MKKLLKIFFTVSVFGFLFSPTFAMNAPESIFTSTIKIDNLPDYLVLDNYLLGNLTDEPVFIYTEDNLDNPRFAIKRANHIEWLWDGDHPSSISDECFRDLDGDGFLPEKCGYVNVNYILSEQALRQIWESNPDIANRWPQFVSTPKNIPFSFKIKYLDSEKILTGEIVFVESDRQTGGWARSRYHLVGDRWCLDGDCGAPIGSEDSNLYLIYLLAIMVVVALAVIFGIKKWRKNSGG